MSSRNSASRDGNPERGRPPSNLARLYTVDEAAEFLGVSPWTIRRWQSQGRIHYVKIGRAVRFDKEDLVKLIERCKVQPGRFGLATDGDT